MSGIEPLPGADPPLDAQALQAAILNHAATAIIAASPTGVISHFNPAAEKMLGYTAQEVLGRYTPELLHDPEEVRARAAELSAELGEPVQPGFDAFVAKTRHGLPNEDVWTYVRKDGSRLPVRLSVSAILDEAGRLRGYLGIARDLTEARRAQEALRSSEEKLRRLFELSPLGIALTSEAGRYIEFNEAFRKISGYEEDELKQLAYWDLTPRKYEADEARQLQSLLETGRYGPYEKEYRRKDGVLVPLRLNGVLMTGSDGGRYVWSIVEDITERRKTEAALLEAMARAEAASRSKTNFLANVSHELRTPLNGVIALARALGVTELTPRQREMVEIIQNSGESLERILSEILDLSKVEAGRLELDCKPFDLASEVRFAAEVMRGKVEEKGLTLRVSIAPEADGLFVGDAVRLKQIVSNLVSNAVKFTESGGVELSLSVAEPLSSGGTPLVVVTVTDTGIGMEPEVLPHLFERFTQADETITRRYGGTGLGLSICKQLAELMDGDISAQSLRGHGSTFTVRIPLPRAAPEAKVAETGGGGSAALPGALRVLLAEDHPTNRRVVELLLEPLQVELTMAENGEEAVAAFRSQRFDLVLMDMQMPVMDGLTATREIRAVEAASGNPPTPIIMLTANTLAVHRDWAIEAGADGFLPKPIKPDGLYAAMEAVFARSGRAEARPASA